MDDPSGSPLRALTVENVTVRFGSNVVFQDLSFHVDRGTTLVVIGPNGAGKTVLFKALIGALPYEGRVTWAPATRLGYIPQKLDVERDLPITGADLLRARTGIAHVQDEAIDAALAQVGLGMDAAKKPIGALSGGQFQRMLLAFALIGEPNVLLLDEAAAGVDAPGQQQFDTLMDELQERTGITIIMISHDLSIVYGRAANILCLSKTYSCFGPPQTVLDPKVLDKIYGMPTGFHVHAH